MRIAGWGGSELHLALPEAREKRQKRRMAATALRIHQM